MESRIVGIDSLLQWLFTIFHTQPHQPIKPNQPPPTFLASKTVQRPALALHRIHPITENHQGFWVGVVGLETETIADVDVDTTYTSERHENDTGHPMRGHQERALSFQE